MANGGASFKSSSSELLRRLFLLPLILHAIDEGVGEGSQ